jgi:hypothetical protein
MNTGLRMIAAGILSLCLSGCIIPLRTPTVTSAPKSLKSDLRFIQTGTTTRQEIEQRLGWSDTHVHDPRLFLGHWGTSSVAIGVVAPGEIGIPERYWDGRTVMVEFDDAAHVLAHRVIDNSHLMEELAAWMDRVHYPPLDLLRPAQVVGVGVADWQQGIPAKWELTQQGIRVHVANYSALMVPKEVKSLRVKGAAENGRYKVGKRTSTLLELDGDGMIKVVRYLQQTGNLRSTR